MVLQRGIINAKEQPREDGQRATTSRQEPEQPRDAKRKLFLENEDTDERKAKSKPNKLSLTAHRKRSRQSDAPSTAPIPATKAAKTSTLALAPPEPRSPAVTHEARSPVTPPLPPPPEPRLPAVLPPPPPPPPRGPARSPALPPPPQPQSQGQDVSMTDLGFEEVSVVNEGEFDIDLMMFGAPEVHSDNAVGDQEEMLVMQGEEIMDANGFVVLPKASDLPNVVASSPESEELVTPTSTLEAAVIEAAHVAQNNPAVQETRDAVDSRPSTSREPNYHRYEVDVYSDDEEGMRMLSFLQERQIQRGHGRRRGFTVVSTHRVMTKKFKIEATEYVLKIDPPRGDINPLQHYENTIRELVKLFKATSKDHNKIGVVLHNESNAGAPIALSYRNVDQLDAETLWTLIYRVTQSNENFLLQGNIVAKVQVVDVPRGSGRIRNRFVLNGTEFAKTNKGIVSVFNIDQRCLAYALVIATTHAQSELEMRKLLKDIQRLREMGANLCVLANCDLANGGSIEELNLFQAVVPANTQIVVFDDLKGKSTYYRGDVANVEKRLNLLLLEGHYYFIKSLTAAFGCSYFCEPCAKPFESKSKHTCTKPCSFCNSNSQCSRQNKYYQVCATCGRSFLNERCYENHFINKINDKQTACQGYNKCKSCLRVYKAYKGRPPHLCGEFYCTVCRNYFPSNHQCYMKRDKVQEPPPDHKTFFIFWDCETQQHIPRSGDAQDGTKHVVNLIAALCQCSKCIAVDDVNYTCHHCGVRKKIFKKEPVKEFLEFLNLKKTTFTHTVVCAHNSSAFDSVLLLKYILLNTPMKPKLIMRGAKIISMTVSNIHFIDSLQFLSMKLSMFPQTLDLGDVLKKGWFPHLANRPEFECYRGPMLALKYYDADQMMAKERDEFLKWYEQRVDENYVFDMAQELEAYCVNDCDILRRGMNKLRQIILDVGNVDIMLECITLANCANRIFRRNFLKDGVIGVLPVRGYRMADLSSKEALIWLLFEEENRGRVIQHAGRAREFRLPCGVLVDGYIPPDANSGNKMGTVFLHSGCLFHGCESCYPCGDVFPLNNDPHDTLALRHEKTMQTLKKLTELGYEVVHMRGCDFKRELKENPDLNVRLNNHPILKDIPLNPRDALYGGRCEAYKMYHNCTEEGEEIRYYDYMSLYPSMCVYFPIPVGHPIIHLGPEFPNIMTLEGLIKCTVLPPRSLYHPVLPMKMNSKLLFILCRTCGMEMRQGRCVHDDEKMRVLEGTWAIPEVKVALQHGYEIVKISEIWEYKCSTYEKDSTERGVFEDYIKTFIKLKAHASGWPSDCVDDATRAQFLQQFVSKEGIDLDPNLMKKNEGMRFVAKTLANSLWGRFCMNVIRSESKIVTSPAELFKMLGDPNIEVKSLLCASEKNVLVTYEKTLDLIQPDPTVNCVVGAYVTCGGRLKLLECFYSLGPRAIYGDTDCAFFTWRPGQEDLKLGNFLGDLTNELPPNTHIKEMVAGGPKHYAAKVVDASDEVVDTIVKVRGITLNYTNSKVVNFDILKGMVIEDPARTGVVRTERKIKRTPDFDIITAPEEKIYRVVFNKRYQVEGSMYTYPYGYTGQYF